MTGIIIKGNKPDPKKSRLESQIALILMKAGVTGPEIDECIAWAFGPGAWYAPVFPDWVDRWHKLHPHAFRIKQSDSFVEVLFTIGFFFISEKRKAELNLKKKGGK